ncbi:MAG TPA: alpha/beta hydrolase family protein [Bryobacteraceae bacterium]|jgi:dienelactone hydrolase|nr:alpha/beta hydrolase family protein [Bryobacteraceae bacterium]
MPIRITRRQLALAGAGAAAAAAQDANNDRLVGALDGFENKIDPKLFDPVQWTLDRRDSAPLKLTFRARTRKEAVAWQKTLRAKIIQLVGGFPEARGELRSRVLEKREFPGYIREKFVFESRPGAAVLGYLILPGNAGGPLPAAICIPGHGRGVDDIVGIDEHGRDRLTRGPYQYDFALQAAEHGMAAVAIEPMAFGCRRDRKTKAKGPAAYACQPVAGSALLLGETMIGWRVFDVMRTIDWIATRPELDARRVGIIGISGGGTCALFSAALDARIRAALVSGYLNTFRASIMSMSHCIDNYIPGILNWAEMYDVAGLIAPRALFSEGGDRDPIFPVEATRESFMRVKKVYEVFGAGGAAEQEIFSGVHEFHGARGLPFLAGALRA